MVILARLRQENKGYSLFLNKKNKPVVLFFNQFGRFASIFFPVGLCWDFFMPCGTLTEFVYTIFLLNLFILSYFTNPSRSSCRSCSLPVEMR